MKWLNFSFSPKQGFVFAAVIFITIIGSAYFFLYVPANQNSLEQKQFRCLQTLEQNAKDKIQNSLAMLNALMDNYQKNNSYPAEAVKKYIAAYPTTNFRLIGPEAVKQVSQKTVSDVGKKDTTGQRTGGGNIPATPPSVQSSAHDTSLTLSNNMLAIRLKKNGTSIGITYTLDQFFGPLLRKDIFDQYLFFKGTSVVYQTFPSGISTLTQDSVRNEKSAFNKNQVKDLTLSGTAYKLFCQQVVLLPGSEVTIGGLLSKDNYDAERNRLPDAAVLLLSIIALSVILGLPWIKLYQIGSQDRLTAADGIFSLLVPMLLTSILVFTFLHYNGDFQQGKDAFKFGARHTVNLINKKLDKEIKQTYKVLRCIDTIINAANGKTDATAHEGFPQIVQNALRSGYGNDSTIRISEVVQLNKSGRELFNWSPHGLASPPGNYSDRMYYTNLRDNKSYYIEYEKKKYPYMIEPVISRVTGSFTTAICMKSLVNDTTYTLLSFNLQALDAPYLTPGFQFAVINNDGKVLYHSDNARQLNETLYDEFSAKEVLSAAVHARKDTAFATDYSGKSYRVYTTSISNLPLTLVVMEASAFDKMRQLNQFFFSFSMMFGYFLVLGLEMLIIFAFSVKSVYYKKHYFDVSWVGPDTRFRVEYNMAFYGNVLIVLSCMFAWVLKPGFFEYLFIFLSAASICFIFQNSLYALHYKAEGGKPYKLKIRGIWVMGGILAILDLVAITIGPNWRIFPYQVILTLMLCGLVFINGKYRNVKKVIARLGRDDYSVSFSMMTFSRLIVTSAVPVFFFYISAFNYNLNLVARYRQSLFLEQMRANGMKDSQSFNKQIKYTDSVWISKFYTDSLPDSNVGKPGLDNGTLQLFQTFTLNSDKALPDISGLDKEPADRSRKYSDLMVPGGAITSCMLPDNHYITLKSYFIQYNLPTFTFDSGWYKGPLYWSLVLLIIAAFWYLFHHVIRRLFGLTLPKDNGWPKIDDIIMETDPLNKLIFLIGAPGAGKLKYIEELINGGALKGKGGADLTLDKADNSKGNVLLADMILIPNNEGNEDPGDGWKSLQTAINDDKYKLIVVNQFEYDIKNKESNRAKLNLLEAILQKNFAKVLIISTVHPVNFLDSLNKQQETATAAVTDATPEHDLERWHVLLGHFRIVIKPLDNKAKALMNLKDWEDVLRYETRTGAMLCEMYDPILRARAKIGRGKIDSDSLALKLGITAHYFYMYIWQSLTKEEKFLLYDLAEDGLVNPFDDYNLVMLISKGLVFRQNGVLRLFNEGFREFILTAIGRLEADKIQQEIKDNGNWNKLKTPLMLMLVALLAFLYVSQKDVYANFKNYLTVIPLGVAAFMQVFTMIKTGSSSKS